MSGRLGRTLPTATGAALARARSRLNSQYPTTPLADLAAELARGTLPVLRDEGAWSSSTGDVCG